MSGDEKNLHIIVNQESSEKQLVEMKTRNRSMTQNAIPFLEEKKEISFIAVGMAHLPGEEGMVRMLELSGFNLKRIYQDGDSKHF